MKKLKAAETLKKYIEHCTNFTWSQPASQKRIKRAEELHPSSLPYCGLMHFHNLITEGNATYEEGNYYGDYYTGLGSFKHELMQRYLGWGKRVVGDWECRHCKATRKFAFYKPCKKCGSPFMEYKELEIRYGENIVGHVDGLVFIDDQYWVIDYKTTSSRALYFYRDALKKGRETKMPYKKNVAQIRSYVPLLEQVFDINVAGWMLIYVSRDSSFRDYEIIGKAMSKKEKVEELSYLELCDEHFSTAVKAAQTKKLKLVLPLIEEKPCGSYKEYKDIFMGDWDTEKCPLGDTKICFDDAKLKKHISKIVREAEAHKPIKHVPTVHVPTVHKPPSKKPTDTL